MTDATPVASPDAVLAFWFEECGFADWFQKSDAFDATLRARFGATHAAACDGGLDDWEETRDGRMALILLLDQMSRNLHRGEPRAFAQDGRARAVARRAIALGDHAVSPPERCLFLYLPFEHSESAADQALCMALYRALGNAEWTEYARQHQVIVDRFGRFPHRNEILGRESTAEEIEFLKQPNSSF